MELYGYFDIIAKTCVDAFLMCIYIMCVCVIISYIHIQMHIERATSADLCATQARSSFGGPNARAQSEMRVSRCPSRKDVSAVAKAGGNFPGGRRHLNRCGCDDDLIHAVNVGGAWKIMEMCDWLVWEVMGLQSGKECGTSELSSMYKQHQATWGSALELIFKCSSNDKKKTKMMGTRRNLFSAERSGDEKSPQSGGVVCPWP